MFRYAKLGAMGGNQNCLEKGVIMDERINKVAVLANRAIYDLEETRKYIDGAPHIKHSVPMNLYGKLVVAIYDFALRHTSTLEVLDLGAREGSVTLPFLELGARIKAVDISESQLTALQAKCAKYAGKLELQCEDVFNAITLIQREGRQYDIIVANSLLHHVPDYIGLIREAIVILSPHGYSFHFKIHQDMIPLDDLL